jgi:hypothetical protein
MNEASTDDQRRRELEILSKIGGFWTSSRRKVGSACFNLSPPTPVRRASIFKKGAVI